MGEVDLSYQFISKYYCLRQINRWWITLFFHLIDMVVANSYILFQEWCDKNPDNEDLHCDKLYGQLQFREELIQQFGAMFGKETPVPESGAARSSSDTKSAVPDRQAAADARATVLAL